MSPAETISPKDLDKLAARPEYQLLLLCSRATLSAADDEQITELLKRQDLHWGHLSVIAAYHGVQPLLYNALRRCDPALLSDEHMDWMLKKVGAKVAHSLALVQALGRLVAIFEREGLRVLPVKGAVLATDVYRGIAQRPFVDIDLLIHPGDFQRVETMLYGMGFGSKELTKVQKRGYLFIHGQYTFWGRVKDLGGSMVVLDVHTGVMPPGYAYAADFDALWSRARTVPLGGEEVRTLSPEDLLMLLCFHGFKNRWDRLKHVCDVAEVVRAYEGMDWDELRRRAKAGRSERVLGLGLYLAHDVLGAELPAGAASELASQRGIQKLGRTLAKRLPQQAHINVERFRERVELNVYGQDSMLGRMRYGAYAIARRASELILPEDD